MDQNNTPKSREATERVRSIREAQLPEDDPEIANVLSNLGNVESAEGNYEEALDLFNQAADIRIKHGDSTVVCFSL
jgi:tetratricopeptide (TPR) repeat protein